LLFWSDPITMFTLAACAFVSFKVTHSTVRFSSQNFRVWALFGSLACFELVWYMLWGRAETHSGYPACGSDSSAGCTEMAFLWFPSGVNLHRLNSAATHSGLVWNYELLYYELFENDFYKEELFHHELLCVSNYNQDSCPHRACVPS
jgi:hypothetical protein